MSDLTKMPVLNVAAYRFVPLSDLPALRETIFNQAASLNLKGTVLLAEEGINLTLAGPATDVRAFLTWLESDSRFAGLTSVLDGVAATRAGTAKESWSQTVPFGKLCVKIKREIIRMNHPTVRPASERAAAVNPETLARWLDQRSDDEGRPLVLVDTRNGFEVSAGRFTGAVDWDIQKFSEFPARVSEHQADLAGKRVITYCTGGIRCEKAALYMAAAGVEHVTQLDGGILRYFEVVGDKHFTGACFVFDERRALAADLAPVSGAPQAAIP